VDKGVDNPAPPECIGLRDKRPEKARKSPTRLPEDPLFFIPRSETAGETLPVALNTPPSKTGT
jgi:hypothetical protein